MPTVEMERRQVVVIGAGDAAIENALGLSRQNRVILINRDDRLSGCDNVGVDNALAAREALFLLRRAGCRHIGVVTSSARTPSLIARERPVEVVTKNVLLGDWGTT